MSRLYDRRVAVTVGTFQFKNNPATSGEPAALGDGSKLRGFRIAFRVDLSSESKANKAQAQIHNLNEDTRGKMSSPKARPQFLIEAGYLDTVAQIFSGEAVEVSTTRNAPGIVTTIKAQDGFKASRQRLDKSYAPGEIVGNVIADLAGSLGVSARRAISRAKSGDFTGGIRQLFNGLTVSGNSKNELDKLAKTYGFDWSIQEGELQMLLPTETTSDEAAFLSPTTGLIGSPVRVIDDKKPGATIVRGRSLLIPKLRPGRSLELESAEISGSFRLLKVSHAGQSDASDFFSEWEALET